MKVNISVHTKLLFILISSTALISCDNPTLRNISLSLGITDPEYSDIQYQDKILDSLLSEIHSLRADDALLSDEYNWITSRLDRCKKVSDIKSCISKENSQHQSKLQSILTEKLLAIPIEEQESSPLKLPADINTLSMDKPDQLPPQMAYAPETGILAYQGGNGKLHIVNLENGAYLYKSEQTYRSNSQKNFLQLSQNGKLLLTQYDNKFELISTETGNKLISKDYSEAGYLTKSGRYILLKTKKALVLLNTHNLEKTDALLEFPFGHKYMSFNSSTNTIATWGLNSNDVVFYSINEEDLSFTKKTRIVINEIRHRRGHKVDRVLFHPDKESAYVFIFNTLFKLNLNNSNYYEYLRLPYYLISQNIIIQDNFIITKAYINKRKEDRATKDHYIDIIDLTQGKFAYAEQPNLRDSVFLPTPIKNTILIGKGLGVQLFNIEKQKLHFQHAEELSPSIAKDRPSEDLTARINQSKATFDKEVKVVGKGQNGIDQALNLGLIRPATDSDLAIWKSKNKNHSALSSRLKLFNKYVILKPVKFSGGLSGANSVIFIAKNSKIAPYGSIGHSIVLFTDTGACKGVMCNNF